VVGGWLRRVLQHHRGGQRVRRGKLVEGKGLGWSSPGEGSGGDENQKHSEVSVTPVRSGHEVAAGEVEFGMVRFSCTKGIGRNDRWRVT
jgi:hypothetical protein